MSYLGEVPKAEGANQTPPQPSPTNGEGVKPRQQAPLSYKRRGDGGEVKPKPLSRLP